MERSNKVYIVRFLIFQLFLCLTRRHALISHRRHNLFSDAQCDKRTHPHCFVYFCVITQKNGTFWSVWRPGRGAYMTPKFQLLRGFCTTHLAAKFHHPVFNRSEVIVLKNKQTNRRHWKHQPRLANLASLCCAGE